MCSPFHATKLTVSIAEKTMLCSQPHTGAPNLTVGTNTYLNSITTVENITATTLGDWASGFAMEVTQFAPRRSAAGGCGI